MKKPVAILSFLVFPVLLFMSFGFLLTKQNLPGSPVDVALVFGTGVEWKARSRWLLVARLYRLGLFRSIIVSGGVLVPGHSVTEAEWFRDHLVALGVPAERILLENRATNTYENAAYAFPILRQHDFHSVVLVMSDYTGLLAFLCAKKAWQGSPVTIYNAHASSGSHWNPWTWWLTKEGWQLTSHAATRFFRYGLLRYL